MKKFLLLGLLIAVFGAVVGTLVYRTRRVKKIVDVTEVEKDIRQHLSTGASRSQVESYLDERRIRHSYVDYSAAGPEYSRTESALIPESSLTWLGRGDIQILFKFDDHDRLVHFSVKEIFTGP